ncbi:DNA polymerase III subunit beta [Gammaproteobacteria bacterium]|nr:DNA polymerase III subunit beta [Gammaproteobacteria bacterium]
MKFIAQKSQIVEALQNAAAVAERRQTIPILANLRIKAQKGQVEVTATDLEIQIQASSSVVSTDEEGETTVSARKMSELCRSLPDNEEINFSLSSGKLTVASKGFHADFSTISADDFPELEISEEQTSSLIGASVLKRILTKTSFSMASQDVRYYLNGLLLEFDNNEIKGVATDGHRLALASSKFENKEGLQLKQILPRKAVLELSKLLPQSEEAVELNVGASYFSVKSGNLQFSTKLIDGKYPDYEKVFPSGDPSSLKIEKEKLQLALSRASVLSNEKYRGVRFALSEGSLKLTANNPEQESAEEVLEVDYRGSPLEIGFNIGYLLDVLGSVETNDVELVFYGEDSSCIIKEPSSDSEVYVIMPMRL